MNDAPFLTMPMNSLCYVTVVLALGMPSCIASHHEQKSDLKLETPSRAEVLPVARITALLDRGEDRRAVVLLNQIHWNEHKLAYSLPVDIHHTIDGRPLYSEVIDGRRAFIRVAGIRVGADDHLISSTRAKIFLITQTGYRDRFAKPVPLFMARDAHTIFDDPPSVRLVK